MRAVNEEFSAEAPKASSGRFEGEPRGKGDLGSRHCDIGGSWVGRH